MIKKVKFYSLGVLSELLNKFVIIFETNAAPVVHPSKEIMQKMEILNIWREKNVIIRNKIGGQECANFFKCCYHPG